MVTAPFAGTVTDVPSIAPGKYLAASTTAFFLVDTDHVWVDATPKETELTYVRPGQPVTVTVDTYPDLEWHGVVESVSPAAAQEFARLAESEPAASGLTTAQAALAWIAQLDGVSTVIPGARNVSQARSNAAAGSASSLGPNFSAGIAAIYDRYFRAAVHERW